MVLSKPTRLKPPSPTPGRGKMHMRPGDSVRRLTTNLGCNGTDPPTAIIIKIFAAILEAIHAGLMISKRL